MQTYKSAYKPSVLLGRSLSRFPQEYFYYALDGMLVHDRITLSTDYLHRCAAKCTLLNNATECHQRREHFYKATARLPAFFDLKFVFRECSIGVN